MVRPATTNNGLLLCRPKMVVLRKCTNIDGVYCELLYHMTLEDACVHYIRVGNGSCPKHLRFCIQPNQDEDLILTFAESCDIETIVRRFDDGYPFAACVASAYHVPSETMRLAWDLATAMPVQDKVLKVRHALRWAAVSRDVYATSLGFRTQLLERRQLAHLLNVQLNDFFTFLIGDVWTDRSTGDAYLLNLGRVLWDLFNAPTGGFSLNLLWVLQHGFSPTDFNTPTAGLLVPHVPFHPLMRRHCIEDPFLHKTAKSRAAISKRIEELRAEGHPGPIQVFNPPPRSFYEELLPRRPIMGTVHMRGAWPVAL